MENQNVVEIKNLKKTMGDKLVLKGINLDVKKGEVLAIVGTSGAGKTTLLRQILGLTSSDKGSSIKVFGNEIINATPETLLAIQKRWGVLFQQNALFSSLTLLENVSFPLREHTKLDPESIKELALLRILMAGLPEDAAIKLPEQLSGGMQKRAGIARAIVLDPELIFLDEPTSGLDPNTASEFDELVLDLQKSMGLTILMVTHDIDSLWKTSNRVAFLSEGVMLAVGPISELIKNPDPRIQAFFNGPRGRAAKDGYQSITDEK